jgi:hypothetical protein
MRIGRQCGKCLLDLSRLNRRFLLLGCVDEKIFEIFATHRCAKVGADGCNEIEILIYCTLRRPGFRIANEPLIEDFLIVAKNDFCCIQGIEHCRGWCENHSDQPNDLTLGGSAGSCARAIRIYYWSIAVPERFAHATAGFYSGH